AEGSHFGQVVQWAVADEPVSACKRLHVALAFGQQPFAGIGELAGDSRRAPRAVDAQQQASRLALLGRRGAVVEQRDQSARLKFGVVLPVEARAGALLE